MARTWPGLASRRTTGLPFFRPSGSTGEPAAAPRGAVPSTVSARRWLLLSLLSLLLSRLITLGDEAGRAASALSRLAQIWAACR
jgi:hypothetical protein